MSMVSLMRRLALLGCALASIGSVHASQQRFVDYDDLRKVEEILFPLEARCYCDFILRFNTQKETSRIVIAREEERIQVKHATLRGNLLSMLNDLLRAGGPSDPSEWAKKLSVSSRTINVPASTLTRWHTTFHAALGTSKEDIIRDRQEFVRDGGYRYTLDGGIYEVRYNGGSASITFELSDRDIDGDESTLNYGIVKWMKGVINEVELLR